MAPAWLESWQDNGISVLYTLLLFMRSGVSDVYDRNLCSQIHLQYLCLICKKLCVHSSYSITVSPGMEGSSYGGGSMGGAVGVAASFNSGFFSSASMAPVISSVDAPRY